MKIQTNRKTALLPSRSFDAIVGEGSFNSRGFAVQTGVLAGSCDANVNDGCPTGQSKNKITGACNNCQNGTEGLDRP